MFRKPFRALAGLAVVGLVAGALALPAGAATHRAAAVQGVTDTEITISALVADLDGLRAKGFNLAPKLTTGNLLKKWQGYADAYGPINGRKVVFKPAVWDPLDPKTFDAACTQATVQNKAFVVVNGNGFRQAAIPCIVIDNKTPMFYGESVTQALIDAAGSNLFSLGIPAPQSGSTAARVATESKIVTSANKVGILSGNGPASTEAATALEAGLKKAGVTVASRIDVNELSADATAINRESAAAVATFQSKSVDYVFVVIPFTWNKGFFQENKASGANLKTMLVDSASSMCTAYGATQTPADAAGTPCATTWDTRAVQAKNSIKKDNEFEAKCRQTANKALGETTQPGGPSGDLVKDGVVLAVEDFPPNECTITTLILDAIKKAGKNLTWSKVAANLQKVKKGPAAMMSDGQGTFSKTKPYYADFAHLVTLNAASPDVVKDANGLYNGCPVQTNCWIPAAAAGATEWFPIK